MGITGAIPGTTGAPVPTIEDHLRREKLERAVVGALRSTFAAHGPITEDWIESAAKRIVGALQALERR